MKPASPQPEPPPGACPAAVRLCGHLRKPASQSRRFFVLHAAPPRLDRYRSEGAFRTGHAPPQRSVSLAGACTVSKRVDARRRPLFVVYTRERSLGAVAASEAEQQAWYSALLEVRAAAAAAGPGPPDDPCTWLAARAQDVWPVTLQPKGLGRARGLGGGYQLCLGPGVLSLLRKPRRALRAPRAPPALRLPLLSVRRCGHADDFFFLELGRSAPTGPGELWLQAPDTAVARSIHEAVLAAMRRLGDPGARVEPAPRDPPVGSARPAVPAPDEARVSSRPSGRSRRRASGESAALPASISMGTGSDYEPMGGGGEAAGYMVMAPPGSREPEYEPMSLFPSGAPSSCLPRSHRDGAGASQGPEGPAGEYVCLRRAPGGRLNYIDLELVPPLEARGGARGGCAGSAHSYAHLDFQSLREARSLRSRP